MVAETVPSDYGLPYDEFWTGQLDAIQNVVELFKTHDIVMLVADTGTGKSGIAKAVSEMFSATTILTRTISLEDQYGALTGLEVGRGRKWHTCSKGMDAYKCWQKEMCEGQCVYRDHVNRLKAQKIRILNYAQFFAFALARTGFDTDLVVCDEGHDLENSLNSFVSLWYGDREPTWGYQHKGLLFQHGKKFLIMSASMIPALIAETMGIENYGVYEAHNDFDYGRNPVFVKPVGYITSRNPHYDRLSSFIDNHISTTQFSGVVHTSSDRQTAEILNRTRYPERFIWPKGAGRAAAFARFKAESNTGRVLISASAYEGQDFVGDECRWQVICKVPYADLGNAQVKARRQERPEIYRLEALQRIQQACGRGMRGPDDWCANYILDATVIGLYEKYGAFLSANFRKSWQGVV